MAKRKARTASPSKRRTTRAAKGAPRVKTLMVRVFKHKRHGGFAKGTRGRPKGAKNKIPGSAKATYKAIMEEVSEKNGRDIYTSFMDGIRGGPAVAHHYHKLYRDSIDGPPDRNVNLTTQFKDDELEKAQKDLTRKIDALFKHVTPTVIPPAEEPAGER